jgi:hypothetical protein
MFLLTSNIGARMVARVSRAAAKETPNPPLATICLEDKRHQAQRILNAIFPRFIELVISLAACHKSAAWRPKAGAAGTDEDGVGAKCPDGVAVAYRRYHRSSRLARLESRSAAPPETCAHVASHSPPDLTSSRR